jgi:hypothetical protein
MNWPDLVDPDSGRFSVTFCKVPRIFPRAVGPAQDAEALIRERPGTDPNLAGEEQARFAANLQCPKPRAMLQ